MFSELVLNLIAAFKPFLHIRLGKVRYMQGLIHLQRRANKTITFIVGFMILFWVQNVIAAGTLSAMRIGQDPDKTRVVFDLKKAQEYSITRLSNPSRVVVDFHDTVNSLSFKRKHITDSRIYVVRVADNKKGTRVVLDMHKSPHYKSFVLAKNKQGKERLVIDFTDEPTSKKVTESKADVAQVKSQKQKTAVAISNDALIAEIKAKMALELAELESEAQPIKAKMSEKLVTKQKIVETKTVKKAAAKKTIALKTETKPVSLKSVENKKPAKPLINLAKTEKSKPLIDRAPKKILNQDSEVFTKSAELIIAIDAGHGGKDPGVIGANKAYEKTVTLKIAKALKEEIDKLPGLSAVLTRDKDVFIPLSKRVKIAKEKQADLFVSIHADAFHDRSVRGGSVYVLSESGASSTMAKLLAKNENAAVDEIELKGLDQDVAFALSDLSRDATIKASHKLAKTVLNKMKLKVKMHKGSVQSAGFAVLKSIDMPSMLIETAFISNPHEARKLVSKRFQRKMANAIADGLAHYAKQVAPKQRWGDTLYVHYKVQRGDTLSGIAHAYQVSTATLKKVNNIKNADTLYIGKNLRIPVPDKLIAGI